MGIFPPKKFNYDRRIYLMDFGKYKGQPIQSIIEKDPGYINWCMLNIIEFNMCDELIELLEKKGFKIEIDKESIQHEYYSMISDLNSGIGPDHPDYDPDLDHDQQDPDIW